MLDSGWCTVLRWHWLQMQMTFGKLDRVVQSSWHSVFSCAFSTINHCVLQGWLRARNGRCCLAMFLLFWEHAEYLKGHVSYISSLISTWNHWEKSIDGTRASILSMLRMSSPWPGRWCCCRNVWVPGGCKMLRERWVSNSVQLNSGTAQGLWGFSPVPPVWCYTIFDSG